MVMMMMIIIIIVIVIIIIKPNTNMKITRRYEDNEHDDE